MANLFLQTSSKTGQSQKRLRIILENNVSDSWEKVENLTRSKKINDFGNCSIQNYH